MVNLEDIFPKLKGSGYQVTSPQDERYNCIAWAAGDTSKWWWPSPGGKEFWPSHVPRTETLGAIQQAFALLSYVECIGADLETGFERIALFADAAGFPLHVARQLATGRWSSKLGGREDIEHALHDLEGNEYGRAVHFMKRRVPLEAERTAKGEDQ